MENRLLNKRAQGTLEMTFVIILMVVLLAGIVNIWLWANNQIVRRQKEYNASRVAAGKSSDSYVRMWPVYTPEPLEEKRVIVDAPKMQ